MWRDYAASNRVRLLLLLRTFATAIAAAFLVLAGAFATLRALPSTLRIILASTGRVAALVVAAGALPALVVVTFTATIFIVRHRNLLGKILGRDPIVPPASFATSIPHGTPES
jgi:hypothetical protein